MRVAEAYRPARISPTAVNPRRPVALPIGGGLAYCLLRWAKLRYGIKWPGKPTPINVKGAPDSPKEPAMTQVSPKDWRNILYDIS